MRAPRREQVLDAAAQDDLRRVIGQVQRWQPGSHAWGHYAEAGPDGPLICRTENLSPCVPEVASLVDGPLACIAAETAGEPVVAFKDKVNYKQPGGGGFLPHQDLRAYPGVRRVVSVLLAIDDADEVSGCLWVAPPTEGVLATDDRGVIAEERTDWIAVPLKQGDALVIDGLAPHFSDRNLSDRERRVLVASYAPVTEGYTRGRYYEARSGEMAAATRKDGRDRISTLADFGGEYVAPATSSTRCTHG